MIKPGIEKDGNKSVLIGVFNSGYVIALLLFLAGSIGSLCDGVIASRGLGVAELAAIGIVYPYTKTMECISLAALIMGRKNKSIVDKLLVMPAEEDRDYETYDFHIGSTLDAKAASTEFGDICKNGIAEKRKSCSCSLALEEIVFNILDYQQANGENNPNIDVHIVLFGNNKMIMRVKDCSKERDPFAKYEYSKESDSLDNIGIKIVKSFAEDIKYSFIYGVNFITITI